MPWHLADPRSNVHPDRRDCGSAWRLPSNEHAPACTTPCSRGTVAGVRPAASAAHGDCAVAGYHHSRARSRRLRFARRSGHPVAQQPGQSVSPRRPSSQGRRVAEVAKGGRRSEGPTGRSRLEDLRWGRRPLSTNPSSGGHRGAPAPQMEASDHHTVATYRPILGRSGAAGQSGQGARLRAGRRSLEGSRTPR